MKKLLIVEDDKNWTDILGKFAVDVGAEYRVAVSGGQAIEIRQLQPEISPNNHQHPSSQHVPCPLAG